MTNEEAARKFARAGVTAQEAADALRRWAEVAKKVPFPPFAQIRKIRLERLKADFGFARIVLPEYWEWKLTRAR